MVTPPPGHAARPDSRMQPPTAGRGDAAHHQWVRTDRRRFANEGYDGDRRDGLGEGDMPGDDDAVLGPDAHRIDGREGQTRILDVRDDLRAGRRPLRRILDAVGALAVAEDLCLYATFEPVPLYALMRLRGFSHAAQRLPDGGWKVHFTRTASHSRGKPAIATPAARPVPSNAERASAPEPDSWLRLDNRGLEPPEPMMRTLQALDTLEPGHGLEIHNDRRPAFLYPHLEERGLQHRTQDEADGSARVRIWG